MYMPEHLACNTLHHIQSSLQAGDTLKSPVNRHRLSCPQRRQLVPGYSTDKANDATKFQLNNHLPQWSELFSSTSLELALSPKSNSVLSFKINRTNKTKRALGRPLSPHSCVCWAVLAVHGSKSVIAPSQGHLPHSSVWFSPP